VSNEVNAMRPTKLNPELMEEICAWLASGRSLRAFCREPAAPHISTVMRWIVVEPEFREQYARARVAAGFAHADSIIDVVELLRDGGIDPQTAKVMMDGLKWAAERMAPKHHSARQEIDHTASDGRIMPRGLPNKYDDGQPGRTLADFYAIEAPDTLS